MKRLLDKLKLVAAVGIFIGMPFLSSAQGGFDDDVEDNPVPFDGGVSLLVAAGIGYGLKKGYDQKKALKKREAGQD